ncbi:hypothetical protein [Halobaculum gomorrense]|uniref:Uncharacterized protein n=1 Tax=Halobaculum gomorrense TaxID=43928 RepID=A0A1M5U321_9EURY|nr:hypothetical protein [Halobaculum gomorrense]SHH57063.1 hypothetical protein SAMN05443636_2886 [Halobaculum gomorrense]
MDPTALLVRLGSLLSVFVGAAALALLLVDGVAGGAVAPAGVVATLGLLVVAVVAAIVRGRRDALARWETPYW